MNSATLSPCGRFRYSLIRRWMFPGRTMLFVMLNPSTADASTDDPTIRRCVQFARDHDCHAIEVVNLSAYRATDPRALFAAGVPEGNSNLRHVMTAARAAEFVVCAWGAHARHKLIAPLARSVLHELREAGIQPWALKLLSDGTPAHPLYLPASLRAEPMP